MKDVWLKGGRKKPNWPHRERKWATESKPKKKLLHDLTQQIIKMRNDSVLWLESSKSSWAKEAREIEMKRSVHS